MSESDYQRGLRGGECQVSISDHDRYFDWAAGRDAYQKARDERIEALLTNSMNSEELSAYYEKKNKEYEREEQAANAIRLKYKNQDKEKAYVALEKGRSTGIILAVIYFPVFLVAGYILRWFLGVFSVNIPVFAIWIISIGLASIIIFEGESNYKKDKERIRRQYGERD